MYSMPRPMSKLNEVANYASYVKLPRDPKKERQRERESETLGNAHD